MLNLLFHPHLIIKDMSYNNIIIKRLLLVLGENLSTIHQATLIVLAAVDKVGVVQSQLNGTVDDVVDGFDTQHERVVLVTDLVAPATETATRPDALLLELGQDLGQSTLTLQRGSGVTVVEAAVIGGDDLVARTEHLSVDETLDRLSEESVVVDGLHGRLGNFQHDRPVRSLLCLGVLRLGAVGQLDGGELLGSFGLIVGRVVGEDGGTVKGAVVLGEVEPALITNALGARATDTNTNDVGGGVEELLGVADQFLVSHGAGKEVDGHGGNESLVTNGGAIGHLDSLVVGVDLDNAALLTEASVLLGDGVGDGNPDATSTATSGETESSVRTPVTGGFVQDNVGGNGLDVGGSDTLTEPSALHLLWLASGSFTEMLRLIYLSSGHSPDLVVVRTHEDVGDTSTHHADNPLIEVLGLGVGDTVLQGSVDHAINALDLLLLGKHGDVVLEGVGNPLTLAADVGDTLVAVPVIVVGKSLVDTVIEVLVVREDDVTTDIVKL